MFWYIMAQLGNLNENVFLKLVEELAQSANHHNTLYILLTTTGGSAITVERYVNIIRHHYSEENFIVPENAYSAGTKISMSPERNNKEYSEFNKIACCSESVRSRFMQGAKIQEEKVYTLRNFYDFDIVDLASGNPYKYENSYITLVTVARLSSEKGIDKAIDALYASGRVDIRYYIIGDGPQKDILQEKIKEYRMEKRIFILGEQQNPYRYMINADYLLVPSLHEAAPMVFDEANLLGLRIISTNTTSAKEMIDEHSGIIYDDLKIVLKQLKSVLYKSLRSRTNQIQIGQFRTLVG